MKKQALLLMAGGVLAFASCNTTTNEGASQAQIDSMVNARVEEIRLEMMAQNDSMINALALIKADSIIAAMKGGAPAPKKPTASKPKATNRGNDVNTGSNTATPVSTTPVNTGKKTGEEGVNTGKKGSQNEGVNTGKKK
jgi:hypothetical protein